MLYRNWLRGVLGSADSETAQKYGRALYDARSLSWEEAEKIRANPETRDATLDAQEARSGTKVAEQIKTEDPEAYEYLQGVNGMDRVGVGLHRGARRADVRDVRPDRVAAGAARLPDLPVGGHRRADPRHGRPDAAGQRGSAPARQRGRRGGLQHRHLRHRRGDLPLRRRPDHEHRAACPAGCRWCWSGSAAWSAGCCCGRTGGSPSSAARTAPRRSRRPAPGTGGSSGTCARRPRSTWPSRAAPASRSSARVATVFVEQTNLRPEARLEDPAHAAAGRARAGRPVGRPAPETLVAAAGRRRVRSVQGTAARRAPRRPEPSARPRRARLHLDRAGRGRAAGVVRDLPAGDRGHHPRAVARRGCAPRRGDRGCGGRSNSSSTGCCRSRWGIALLIAVLVLGSGRRRPDLRRRYHRSGRCSTPRPPSRPSAWTPRTTTASSTPNRRRHCAPARARRSRRRWRTRSPRPGWTTGT